MKKGMLALLAVLLFSALNARAILVAYEGFDITPGAGALAGASGATSFGWTNVWSTGVANNVVSESLGYINNGVLNTVGGAAQLTVAGGGSFRHFTPPYSTGTGTYWISFIAVVRTNSSYAGLSLVNAFNEMLFVGDLNSGTNWGAQAYGTNAIITNTTLAVTNAAFIVIRVDFNVGGGALDDTRIWINPDLSAGVPENGAASLNLLGVNLSGDGNARFGRIRIQQGTAGSNAVFDEIRIGTTWESVTPLGGSYTPPEPASFSVLGMGSGAVLVTVSNLTVGATNDLQRTYDLAGGVWETATTFVAESAISNLTDAVGASNAVLYRVTSY
ncbi:MAG TPA: hypothetical protein PKE12_11335 [Kiritimatiellia bacterium]|nr:hypothetical protein [Kiritimatiellia bacterium]